MVLEAGELGATEWPAEGDDARRSSPVGASDLRRLARDKEDDAE